MASQGGNHISHEWVEERLSAYIDNQLDTLERAQIERHLRDCVNCRASLSSLQWTISLVKQAPAPVLSRSFTLPVPQESKRAASSIVNLGFAARWATVVATLLLFAVVGIDVINQFGGATSAKPAMAPAAEYQAVPTNIALAQPTAAPNAARDSVSVPPASSSAASSVAPTRAPEPTKAPAPAGAAPAALPPAPAPTFRGPASSSAASSSPAVGSGAFETSTTPDSSKSITTTAKMSSAITAAPSPTTTPTETLTTVPTATLAPSPTAPIVAQARSEPTRAPLPGQSGATRPTEIISPLRIAEIALLFVAVFFGTIVILLQRR